MNGLLLVDLDGTLIDRAAGFERWAAEFLLLRRLGRYSGDELRWLVEADADGMAPRQTLFDTARERYRLPDDTSGLVATFRDSFPSFIPAPAPEALLALRAARQAGYRLCIVTNGSVYMQKRKITSELAAAVDGYVISEGVGAAKPDPAILHAAAVHVGSRLTSEAWCIGDRPETDILGAARAGIRSAWINGDAEWNPELPYRPTLESTDVSAAIQRILAA